MTSLLMNTCFNVIYWSLELFRSRHHQRNWSPLFSSSSSSLSLAIINHCRVKASSRWHHNHIVLPCAFLIQVTFRKLVISSRHLVFCLPGRLEPFLGVHFSVVIVIRPIIVINYIESSNKWIFLNDSDIFHYGNEILFPVPTPQAIFILSNLLCCIFCF